MALRRSARLSALLPLQASIQPNKHSRAPSSQPSNGVTKTRKSSTKEKKNLKKNKPLDLKSLPKHLLEPLTEPNHPDQPAAQNTPTYWDPSPTSTTRFQRPQTPPPLDRPVEPHRTNATLLTPHGSSLVAYAPGTEDISPSKSGLPRPTATTGTLLEKAIAHLLATDPRLEPLIKQHHCNLFSPQGLAEKTDPFHSLVSTIIGQQVSGAAAKSIKERFITLLYNLNHAAAPPPQSQPPYFPSPEEIVRCDIPTLRTAGLSQRKAEYILGLSEKFVNGELSARMLLDASDEELLQRLTAVRGLGRWSVEMFACFTLKRIDVFSTGDLGVQRGCAAFLGKDVSKLKAKGGKFKYMSENDMLELAAKFSPYRSLFMWYMWRVEEVDISVMSSN